MLHILGLQNDHIGAGVLAARKISIRRKGNVVLF
jgi:hypothetical protein